MNIWTSETVVRAVGWTLVHFVWEGLVVAALLAVALRLMRRSPAHWRYLAGCGALAAMAVAPLVTFQIVLEQDSLPLVAVTTVIAQTMPADSALLGERQTPSATSSIARASTLPLVGDDVRSLKHFRFFGLQLETPHVVSYLFDELERLDGWLPWLVTGWLIGVSLLSCRLLAGWWQVRRLARVACGAAGEIWERKLAELARRLGVNRSIRLLQSALVEVPTVVGWLRPVILLPASCLTGLTPGQLEAILAHELAHIRRHDYLINLLQSAVETLLFYHPAVWWVSRNVREERENCCDDLAVAVSGDRVGYARALATLEELRPAPAQLVLAAGGAPLLRRIRRLAGRPERSAGRASWPVAGVVLLLGAGLVALGTHEHRAQAAEQGTASGSVTQVSATATPQNLEAIGMALPDPPQDREAPRIATVGILTDAQFAAVKQALQARTSQTNLANPDSENLDSISPEELLATPTASGLTTADMDLIEKALEPNVVFGSMPATPPTPGAANANSNLPVMSARPAQIRVEAEHPGTPLPDLQIRTFFVTNTGFAAALRAATGTDLSSGWEPVQVAIRKYFAAMGVDLSTNSGKAVIYNDGTGRLTIRATAEDLDVIEKALQVVNAAQPEVNIKVKFFEITQNDTRAFGFQWTLGGIRLGSNGATVLSGGTAPSLDGSPSAVSPTGFFPGTTNTLTGGTAAPTMVAPPVQNAGSNATAGPQNAPRVATITGTLTAPQYAAVLQALEQRDNTEILTLPEQTTLSGREVQFQSSEPRAAGPGSSIPTNLAFGTNTVFRSWPTLNLTASVSPDGNSISLAATTRVPEFVGYDIPGQFVPQASVPSGGTITSVLPRPHFRLHESAARVTIQDGQTVALGGWLSNGIVSATDKVPLLGDLPLIGRLFRSESAHTVRKNLMIFITVTLVNPDVTRFHSDDERDALGAAPPPPR